jgi:hypothetical protein
MMGAPACCTRDYDVLADNGREYRTHADTPDDACRQVADTYNVAVIAWRRPPTALVLAHPRQIIG